LTTSEGAFKGEPAITDLDRYNREYAGFMRGKAKFVLCYMNPHAPDARPPENHFSGRAMDEWSVFKLAVIALHAERVEWIECNGF
jgi:hypothetical protein